MVARARASSSREGCCAARELREAWLMANDCFSSVAMMTLAVVVMMLGK